MEVVKSYLKANDKCALLFVAPWCPHCTAALPEFVAASAETSVPMAVANAELLPRAAIQGQYALVQITRFPFCVIRDGSSVNVLNNVKKEAVLSALGNTKNATQSEAALKSFFH